MVAEAALQPALRPVHSSLQPSESCPPLVQCTQPIDPKHKKYYDRLVKEGKKGEGGVGPKRPND